VLEPRILLAALAVDPSVRLDPLEKEPQLEEPEHWLMRRLQKRRPVQMTEAVSSLDVNPSRALGNALAQRLKHAERRRVNVMILKFCVVLETIGEKQIPQLSDKRPNCLTAENIRPSRTFTVRQQGIPIQPSIP
jgi:hypothetical protein